MSIRMFQLVCVLAIFLGSMTAQAQQKKECFEQLKALYAEMDRKFKENSDHGFYLNYTILTVLSEKNGGQTHSSNIKLYSNKDKSYLVSNEIEIYQDQKTSVSILPAKKTIYIIDALGNKQKENKVQQLSFLQDTVFSLSTIEYCQDVKMKDGKNYQKIKLNVTNKGQELVKVKNMEFLISHDAPEIKEVEVNFVEKHDMKQMKVSFHQIDYHSKTPLLESSPLSMIYQENGMLQQKYQDFELINTREQ